MGIVGKLTHECKYIFLLLLCKIKTVQKPIVFQLPDKKNYICFDSDGLRTVNAKMCKPQYATRVAKKIQNVKFSKLFKCLFGLDYEFVIPIFEREKTPKKG